MGEKPDGSDSSPLIGDDADEGGVDSVERGPGHESYDAMFGFRCVGFSEADLVPRLTQAVPVPPHGPGRAQCRASDSALVDSWCGIAYRDPFPAPPFKLCVRVSRTQLPDEFS